MRLPKGGKYQQQQVVPETAILLQKSIWGIKGQEGHMGGQKGAREGKKGAAPFYFGLAGTLNTDINSKLVLKRTLISTQHSA